MHEVKGSALNLAPQVDGEEKRGEELEALIHDLQTEADRRVKLKLPIEKRWLQDLRQYHGHYVDEHRSEFSKLTETGSTTKKVGSQVFQNITRPKTNSLIARLWDLLFPTDDRNWGISPTPVPELEEEQEEKASLVTDARDTRDDAKRRLEEATKEGDTEAQELAGADFDKAEEILTAAEKAAEELHNSIQLATGRARLMEREIEDQLTHCQFPSEARDVIEDACKIGTGIIKGPVLGGRLKSKYNKVAAPEGSAQIYELTQEPSNMPEAYWVDPWSFFPDPDQRRVADSESFYQRHLNNKSQMRKLAKRPDIDEEAVRRLLKDDPKTKVPTYLNDLHSITQTGSNANREFYHVWEFTGPLEPEQIELLAEHTGKDGLKQLAEEIDPLIEIHAKVWFCQNEVLSFSLHPLDSQEPIYNAFCPEHDEASPWGFGIPYIMRHSQAIINAAQRMMMDNAALATGPQILINSDAVTPVNGSWELTPRKLWKLNNTDNVSGQAPFDTFSIDMNQTELANIIELERKTIDEITAMPALAQGEQGAGVTKMAGDLATGS